MPNWAKISIGNESRLANVNINKLSLIVPIANFILYVEGSE